MHTKDRTIQMITRLSDPVIGLEIWKRFLEEWEPVNRSRHRANADTIAAMSSDGKQRSSVGGVGERPVQRYEAQNLDTLRDTIKAAILAHNPQDSEWCRCVRQVHEEARSAQLAAAQRLLELQEARRVLEGATQPSGAARQHAPALHQALLAHGDARCQRGPRREHRRDLVPPPAGASDQMVPSRCQAGPAAGQRNGGHDIHDRLQHGRGPLDMLVQIVHAGQDRRPSCPSSPGRSALVTSCQRGLGDDGTPAARCHSESC